jgi:flagellar biosynthesis GTPase FlhF
MKIFLATLLLVSLAANAFLWNASSKQRGELAALQERAGELEELRRQNQDLQAAQANKAGATSDADTKELARLRNEVSQLRKTAAEVNTLRAQTAEMAQLRAQLASANQNLAQKEKDLNAAAVGAEQSEQVQQAKQRAQSIMCMNNMKQIGLAARLWADAHGNVFPPDLASMKNELVTPKILFCPAAPGGVQATDWTQLNPTTISYQFLNPNGNEADPQKTLTMCPIHRHVGLSDGSVQTVGLR